MSSLFWKEVQKRDVSSTKRAGGRKCLETLTALKVNESPSVFCLCQSSLEPCFLDNQIQLLVQMETNQFSCVCADLYFGGPGMVLHGEALEAEVAEG